MALSAAELSHLDDTTPTALCRLAVLHGTDKQPAVHSYTPVYAALLAERTMPVRDLLEIGIGTDAYMAPYFHGYRTGASLRMWRDFLPEANIVGLDVLPDAMIADEARIETHMCSSVEAEEAKRVLDGIGRRYDVIIDDGDHAAQAQLRTLVNCLPYLQPDGIYVIEDCWDEQHDFNCWQRTLGRREMEQLFDGYTIDFVERYNYGKKQQDSLLVVVRPKPPATR